MPGEPLQTVAIAYSQTQLALLLSRLENEGIWVAPASYHQIAAQWWMTVALGGVAVQVREFDAETARTLLSSLEPYAFRERIFSAYRPVELVLIAGLFVTGFFVPPARIPMDVVFGEGRAAIRE